MKILNVLVWFTIAVIAAAIVPVIVSVFFIYMLFRFIIKDFLPTVFKDHKQRAVVNQYGVLTMEDKEDLDNYYKSQCRKDTIYIPSEWD